MKNLNKSDSCSKICTFGFGEKLFTRITFFLSIAIGFYSIWLSSPIFAAGYLGYACVGYFLLMRFTVCARCPHVFVANDCLFIPAWLVKIYVAKRTGELQIWEKAILFGAVCGTVVIPLYWLKADLLLLAFYLAVTVGCFGFLYTRICKEKCQVEVCPLNRRRV